MNEEMMTNEVVTNEIVENVASQQTEIAPESSGSNSGLTFALGAAAGAAGAAVIMYAPRAIRWVKGKFQNAKRKRAIRKQMNAAIDAATANGKGFKVVDDDEDEEFEEFDEE